MRLAGEVAIITGAGLGIGRVFARRLAEVEAKAVIAYINLENAYKAERGLQAEGKVDFAVKADVTDEGSMAEVSRAAAERYGHIDILMEGCA